MSTYIHSESNPGTPVSAGPETRRYSSFAKTPEQLANVLDVAQAVGISATAITDPEEAASSYSALAVEQNARRELIERTITLDPVAHANTARKRVAAGEALVLFTSDWETAMTPFTEEYDRRFGADARRAL